MLPIPLHRFLPCLLIAFALTGSVAFAQQQPNERRLDRSVPSYRVFSLTDEEMQSAVNFLSTVLESDSRGIRVLAENNRLVVMGANDEELRALQDFIQTGSSREAPVLRVFQLKYVDPEQTAVNVQSMFDGVRVAFDGRTNSLLLTGRLATIDAVTELIRQLDTPPGEVARARAGGENDLAGNYKIEFFWVAERDAREEGELPPRYATPANIKTALDELRSGGFGELILGGRASVVNTLGGGDFEVATSEPLGVLSIHGDLRRADNNTLAMQLRIGMLDKKTGATSALASTIQVVPGKDLILGIASLNDSPNAGRSALIIRVDK